MTTSSLSAFLDQSVSGLDRRFTDLIDSYMSMDNPQYARLTKFTHMSHKNAGRLARSKFGDLTIEDLNNPRIRMAFKRWRDEAADTPCAADKRITFLNVVLDKAVDDGVLDVNHARGISRIYRPSRPIRIWTEADFEAFKTVVNPAVYQVIDIGRLTGGRLSALLQLTPENLRSGWLDFDPLKRGNRVRIKLSEYPELEEKISHLNLEGPNLLLTARGKPWSPESYRKLFQVAKKKIGSELRFHDLRATAITNWSKKLTIAKIALLTGHSLNTVSTMLNNFYLQRNDDRVVDALRQLNN